MIITDNNYLLSVSHDHIAGSSYRLLKVVCLLRYHGRWILTKKEKKLFFAVQIEKTEINILQKKFGRKSFFTFQDRREKLFLNLINP